jgi:FlaA1/EpsC-like NDP-sugar epimerase
VRDSAHPDGDIEITVTGLRPGEKLYEELLIGDNPEATAHPRILRAREDMLPWDQLQPHLDRLQAAALADDHAAMRAVLSACVQGFGVPAALTMR